MIGGMSDDSAKSPKKPTAIHYALVVVFLLSIVGGLGWFLAEQVNGKLRVRSRKLVDENAELRAENAELKARNEFLSSEVGRLSVPN